VIPGRRLADGYTGPDQAGCYWITPAGDWRVVPPAPKFPGAVLAPAHHVEVHEDLTITVSPSILLELGNGKRWHGYLERGMWRALGDCVLTTPPTETP
jgi:hypothetical protein